MSISEGPAAPAGGPPPAKANSFERIVGAFISPNETFASIVRQPDWVVPLVILIVVSLVGGIIFAQRVDMAAPIRAQMEQSGNASPDQIDRAVRIGSAFGKIFAYASPVVSVIILLIVAAVLLLAFRLFGGEGDFRQAWSVTLYAWMPGILKSIILTAIIAAKGMAVTDLPTALRSNLAFLVSLKEHPLLFALLARLDVFSIWLLVLLIIGFACMSRLSRAKSASIVIILWLVATSLSLIGPAIQALRR